jgi:hypothetical protein
LPKRKITEQLARWEAGLRLPDHVPNDAEAWSRLFGGNAEEKQAATMRQRGFRPEPEKAKEALKAYRQRIAEELLGPAADLDDPGTFQAVIREHNRRASSRPRPDLSASSKATRLRERRTLGEEKYKERLRIRLKKATRSRTIAGYQKAKKVLEALDVRSDTENALLALAGDGFAQLKGRVPADVGSVRELVSQLQVRERAKTRQTMGERAGRGQTVLGWLWRTNRNFTRPQTRDERLGPWFGRAWSRAWKSKGQLPPAVTFFRPSTTGRPGKQRIPEPHRSSGWIGMMEVAAMVEYLHDVDRLYDREIGHRFGWRVVAGDTCPAAAAFRGVAKALGKDALRQAPRWQDLWASARASIKANLLKLKLAQTY